MRWNKIMATQLFLLELPPPPVLLLLPPLARRQSGRKRHNLKQLVPLWFGGGDPRGIVNARGGGRSKREAPN